MFPPTEPRDQCLERSAGVKNAAEWAVTFVAMLTRLARDGLVGEAGIFSVQPVVVSIFLPERALNAMQRGHDLESVATRKLV